MARSPVDSGHIIDSRLIHLIHLTYICRNADAFVTSSKYSIILSEMQNSLSVLKKSLHELKAFHMQPDPGEEYKAVIQYSRSLWCMPLIKFEIPFMRLKFGMRLVIMREQWSTHHELEESLTAFHRREIVLSWYSDLDASGMSPDPYLVVVMMGEKRPHLSTNGISLSQFLILVLDF